jgi:truncated hemoglobin YjbI
MVVPRIDQSYYELLGGEAGVRTLVDDFYDHMALDERFAGIRAMHPQDMSTSRDKLFWFYPAGWVAHRYLRKSLATHDCGHAICHFPLENPSGISG